MLFWAAVIGMILVTVLPSVVLTIILMWGVVRSEAIALGPELMAQEKAQRAKYWWVWLLFFGLLFIVGFALTQLPLSSAEFVIHTFFIAPMMLMACSWVSWSFLQLARSHQKIVIGRGLPQVVVLLLGLLGLGWSLAAGVTRVYYIGTIDDFPSEMVLASTLLSFLGVIPNAFSERGINFNSGFIRWSKVKGYVWQLGGGQTDVLTIQLDQKGANVRHIPIPAAKKAAVQPLLDQYAPPTQPK